MRNLALGLVVLCVSACAKKDDPSPETRGVFKAGLCYASQGYEGQDLKLARVEPRVGYKSLQTSLLSGPAESASGLLVYFAGQEKPMLLINSDGDYTSKPQMTIAEARSAASEIVALARTAKTIKLNCNPAALRKYFLPEKSQADANRVSDIEGTATISEVLY